MEISQAIILGVIQGLTELLPISSSAHLNIIPWLLKWTENVGFVESFQAFDVALHIGTLFAIALFFFKDWLNLFKGAYKQTIKKEKNPEGKMFWYLVAATIPGGLIGYVLDDVIENLLKGKDVFGYIIMATALIVMGVVLYIVDKKSKSEVKYENMNFKQTFLIGFSQALAFIPGVSRSGITMTTARAMNIERASAAKFSFLLATPITFAAALFKMDEFVLSPAFFVGIIASCLSGLVVIKLLLKYLQKSDFKVFAIYRVLFGAFVLATAIFRM